MGRWAADCASGFDATQLSPVFCRAAAGRFGIHGASLLAKIAVIIGVGLGFGMPAADAMAASLSVTVSPAAVHPGVRYAVTVTGRYDKQARRTAPYLLAFIQYSARACRPTGTAEYSLPSSEWSWDVYPQRAETLSPFKTVTYWKAGPSLGSRRVCAYLYADQVTPSSTAKPLASASAGFRNIGR